MMHIEKWLPTYMCSICIQDVCGPFGEVEKAEHHAHHGPGPAGTPPSFIPGFPWQKRKSPLALSIILHMIMHKQGRKTLSKELRIDCQRLFQEMEIQFENK